MTVLLKVPYVWKDSAKKLGARWDPVLKTWYKAIAFEEFTKFRNWLYLDTALIYKQFYVLESEATCFNCRNTMNVVALGFSHFTLLKDYDEDKLQKDAEKEDKSIHLAWITNEKCIPPLLLHYLKSQYLLKMNRDRVYGHDVFSNTCHYCHQSVNNDQLLNNPQSPFVAATLSHSVIEKIAKIKIYKVKLQDVIPLSLVDYVEHDGDAAYLEYANVQELQLKEEQSSEGLSYSELFCISGS